MAARKFLLALSLHRTTMYSPEYRLGLEKVVNWLQVNCYIHAEVDIKS